MVEQSLRLKFKLYYYSAIPQRESIVIYPKINKAQKLIDPKSDKSAYKLYFNLVIGYNKKFQ